jgi:hypothetical protein
VQDQQDKTDDRALVAAMCAEIDAVQEDNRRALAQLKPHERARFGAWLRSRAYATPPVRPPSRPVNGRAPRVARNQRRRGSRRGERSSSSSSDDPDGESSERPPPGGSVSFRTAAVRSRRPVRPRRGTAATSTPTSRGSVASAAVSGCQA